ncbi:GNAT family N-acetyltransferase [Deinococcus alpinitundrae]|uniref:GNAT family N-acetyltransferase n=1 Tax=Deinococcus alpinitundrae TaxID=468913 RepID=UPI00137983ED|nr:GNAT family N-acetyltransferase [Deinococcus alpinitundrae]
MTRASQSDWNELTALLIDTFAQTPDAQGLPRWSWETARKALQFNPQLHPDWLVCARRDTELLGFTAALNLPGMAYNQMTSVREAARGQDLAYALKTELLGRSKADSVMCVRTHKHTANVAMLRVNEKLGYRQQHGRWEVQRGPGRS